MKTPIPLLPINPFRPLSGLFCLETCGWTFTLKEALKHLPPRELKIVQMRFYGGKTQMEIASEIGISQAQVSRLEKGALERIRREM